MLHSRRRFLKLSAAALSAPAVARSAFAQTAWPAAKLIRAIVPFTAGSTIDILGRIVLDPVSRQIGQTIVVENRGGAGGSLGSALVAKAEPDGYTLLINAAAHSGAPAAYPNLPYDAANDFAGVACFGSVPNVLLVAPSKGIKTVQDLVANAKAGSMTFASAGVGSATHWAAERFNRQRRLPADACAVPRRPRSAHRSDDRTRRFHLHRHLVRPALHQGRQARSARGLVGQTLADFAGRSNHAGSSATGIPTSISGTGCWCRQRRRCRSSNGCTRR